MFSLLMCSLLFLSFCRTQIVSVKRDVAEATRPELGGAYEGCLDQFERGMSAERLRQVFAELKSGLVPLLRAIQEKVGRMRVLACSSSFVHDLAS